MKHTFNADDVRRHYHGPVRPPLKTIAELATEFGLTSRQLAAYIGHSLDAPSPELKIGSTKNKNKNTWYKPAEVRSWWKKHPANVKS